MPYPESDNHINDLYGNRTRVRSCGILIEEKKILLVGHKGLDSDRTFWAPPGGGIEYLESSEAALIREFKEETGLDVVKEDFLGVYEYIKSPLHSVELFYSVKKTGGILEKGHDPESNLSTQIIQEVRWFDLEDLDTKGKNEWFHPILLGIDLSIKPLSPFIYKNSR